MTPASENRYPPSGWITLREAMEIAERQRAEITMQEIRKRIEDLMGDRKC